MKRTKIEITLPKTITKEEFVNSVINASAQIEGYARVQTLYESDAEKAFDLAKEYRYTRVYSQDGFTPACYKYHSLITRVTVTQDSDFFYIATERVDATRSSGRARRVIVKTPL